MSKITTQITTHSVCVNYTFWIEITHFGHRNYTLTRSHVGSPVIHMHMTKVYTFYYTEHMEELENIRKDTCSLCSDQL